MTTSRDAFGGLPETDFRHDAMAVAALSLAPAIGLGVARFAYALVLPDMRADLDWSYADAGWMNATNAAGYLLGALFAARAIAVAGAFRILTVGVWLCIGALLLCALFRNAVPLNAARLIAGLGGGLAFVSGGVLATRQAQRRAAHAAFLLGLFYAGPGFGILMSGLTLPFILDWKGPGSWPWAWGALTLLTLPMAIGLNFARTHDMDSARASHAKPSAAHMRWLLCAYLIFGGGYISYMTFMIAWVQGSAEGAFFQALFWGVLGVAAMASPVIWAGVHKRFLHGHAFAFLTSIIAIAAALPLLSSSPPVLLASAALFGSSFFAVVAATTVFVRRNLLQAQWSSGIGMLTVVFGVGQMLGPVAIGFINNKMGGLASGLWASVFLLAAAAAISMLQRDYEASPA